MSDLERLRLLRDEDACNLYASLRGDIAPEVHLEGALIAWRLGRYHTALRAVREGLALEPAGDLLGMLQFEHATLLRAIGKYEESITEAQKWIADVDQYPGLVPKGYLGCVHFDIALTSRQLERFSQSIEHYRIALDEFQRHGHPTYVTMTLLNLAWAACLSGEVEIAADALRQAEPHSSEQPLVWHHRLTCAFLLAVSDDGDLRRVMDLCREVIEAEGDVPPEVKSHAYWLSGRIALELGLIDTAQVMVEQALLYGARTIDPERCITDAARLMWEIRERRDNGAPNTPVINYAN